MSTALPRFRPGLGVDCWMHVECGLVLLVGPYQVWKLREFAAVTDEGAQDKSGVVDFCASATVPIFCGFPVEVTAFRGVLNFVAVVEYSLLWPALSRLEAKSLGVAAAVWDVLIGDLYESLLILYRQFLNFF